MSCGSFFDTLCMVKYKYIILYMEFGVILYTPHKQFYILPQAEELVHVKDWMGSTTTPLHGLKEVSVWKI